MQKRIDLAKEETTMGAINKILILHGWAYSTEKWEPFINSLKNKGFNTKLLRIPGLTEKLESVWNIENYVEWLNGKIDKTEKVILIGHSNGGRILLAFAAKYPQKIQQIILIDSAGVYHNELSIRLKRFIFKTIAGIGKKITSSESLRRVLYKLAKESDYEKATPLVRQTMINLITYDITKVLNKVVIPTLIIWGGKDKITPLSDAKLFHRLIKGSKLSIIKSSKHSPQFTHTDKVVEIILQEIR